MIWVTARNCLNLGDLRNTSLMFVYFPLVFSLFHVILALFSSYFDLNFALFLVCFTMHQLLHARSQAETGKASRRMFNTYDKESPCFTISYCSFTWPLSLLLFLLHSHYLLHYRHLLYTTSQCHISTYNHSFYSPYNTTTYTQISRITSNLFLGTYI